MNNIHKKMLLAAGLLLSAGAAQAVDVSAEAAQFQTEFLAAAAVIGATFLVAGYGSIVWKWAKGMLFS